MPVKEKVKETAKEEKKEEKKPAPVGEYDCYINREISWLAFNQRVLLEAADNNVPLLERLKFLMIYQSNLEEFYRVRVGILTHRALLTPDKRDPLSGWLPSEQIEQVVTVTREQQQLAETVWKVLKSEFKVNGIDILDFKKISKVDELMSKKLFGDLKNMLAPQIIDVSQPLPFLWGEESYVIAFLGRNAEQKLAIIPLDRIPPYLSFEIEGSQKIVLTSQLVRHFLPLLLKKENVIQSAVIRVTRNADVFLSDVAETGSNDLRRKMESMLTKRKRELPVRVQIYGKLTDTARGLLLKKLRLTENRAFNVNVPFDLSFRSCIGGRDGFKYEERKPIRSIGLNKGEYFKYIEKHDLLLSFPFQSMLPFVDLIYEAADDPDVLSIKITLYRLSSSSKVAAALAYAADKGKDVLCLLELRARFDEQNNIDYSEMLEDAGCTVIYGLPNHKVHSKLCVITRQHDGNISHITQVGTGNYNEVTSEQYTDLSLITADEGAAEDAEAAFTALCRDQFPPEAHTLWIAPNSFKTRVIDMLDREKAKGSKGRVAIKINAINNRDVMEKLIECSQAGVKIELFVRGICCLRPDIPGMTENITIKSVVGRWLEHSRIYSFGEGADQRIFIGSGDLLSRNLERRVEAFMEAVTPDTKAQLNAIIDAMRKDKEKSRTMKSDGTYYREQGGEGTGSQEALYRYFSKINVNDLHKVSEDTPKPKPTPQSPKPETPKTAEPKKEAAAPEKPKAEEPKKEAPKPAAETKPTQPAAKPVQPAAKPTARAQTAAKPVPRPAPVRTNTKKGLFGWLLGRK